MGANAQTSVPAFTTGQVLTAQQQTEINTGVPVFATTTTRDAAFGGTGEKTLAEGQLAYIEASNVVQYYDGASWLTLAPTASGLTFITGASFTTATSFSAPDNTFTSTYRNYRIFINITALTADADFTMRMRASGSDNTTTNYQSAWSGIDTGAAALTRCAVNATSWTMSESDTANVRSNYVFDLVQPQVAQFTYVNGNYSFADKAVSYTASMQGTSIFTATTQFDSFTFISSVASSLTGVYRVYGYSDS
jgi:hypothetical protein